MSSGFILVVGDFNQYDEKNFNHIVRLNNDGALDLTFGVGAGSNGNLSQAIEDALGRIVLVGDFTSFNGEKRSGVVRLLADGSVDQSLDPGSGATGITGIVEEWNGSLVVVGQFDRFNGVQVPGVARLSSDGVLDHSFLGELPSIDGQVSNVTLQDDGRILLAGDFRVSAGEGDSSLNYTNIARLNRDGGLDSSFQPNMAKADPATHLDGPVHAVAIQPDGRIILGGSFASFSGLERAGIIRIDYNGELDHSINFGSGANDAVLALAVQDDFRIVLGGNFSQSRLQSGPRAV